MGKQAIELQSRAIKQKTATIKSSIDTPSSSFCHKTECLETCRFYIFFSQTTRPWHILVKIPSDRD